VKALKNGGVGGAIGKSSPRVVLTKSSLREGAQEPRTTTLKKKGRRWQERGGESDDRKNVK